MNLTILARRGFIIYLLLSLPALVVEAFLTLTILSNFNVGGIGVFAYLKLLPFLLIIGSAYSLIRFRISALLSLFVVSYFLSSILTGSASLQFSGFYLNSTQSAFLVIVCFFAVLVSFNFLRSAQIQKEKPLTDSKGPFFHQLAGLFIDLLAPILVSVLLILASSDITRLLLGEARMFPPPLSDIFSSFLLSPIVVVIVTAITLIVIKDFAEPLILYYSLTKDEAVRIVTAEAKQLLPKHSTRISYWKQVIVSVVMVVLLTLLFGPEQVIQNTLAIFGLGHPTSQQALEQQIGTIFKEAVNALSTLIKWLWG